MYAFENTCTSKSERVYSIQIIIKPYAPSTEHGQRILLALPREFLNQHVFQPMLSHGIASDDFSWPGRENPLLNTLTGHT